MKPKPGRCHECKLERRRAAYRLKHGEPKNAVRGRVEPDGRRPCGSGEHDLRVDGRQRKDNGTWFCVPCNARRDAVRKASVRAAREAWQIAHKGNAA
jgi:hypothetical protein